MRVLLIGIFHETHCFVPDTTGLEAFAIRRDEEILRARGDGGQIDGFLEVAEQEGWEVVPTVSYVATPSGMVEDNVIEAFFAEALPRVEAAVQSGLDAVYLSLHGAMIAQSEVDVEGLLISRLRAIKGLETLPFFGVFDLHANLTEAMTAGSNLITCYRYNPHTDARESAVRAAKLLARALHEKTELRQFRRSVPIIWPPTGTGTADTPMKDLTALARSIEDENPEIWGINVVAGFSFADSPDAGVCFSVSTAGSASVAETALDRLASLADALKEKGLPAEYTPEGALKAAQNLPPGNGPIVLVEPSENIGAGAPGNGTALLRAFMAADALNAGVIINDPEAVQELASVAIGASYSLSLGGKGNPFDEGPVTLEVTLVSRSDGKFDLEDLHSHMIASRGKHIEMGDCALVRHRGVVILITSERTSPNDLGQWRSQGVAPEELSLIAVKAAVAHRQAYDKIQRASFTVSTAGACTSDPCALPYTKLRRPIFPLDR